MRALLLDIGNTSIKIGLASEDGILTSFNVPTSMRCGGDFLGLQLRDLIRHAESEIGEGHPEICVVSSVVPAMNPLVRHACTRYLNIESYFAHVDFSIPLENRYECPTEVGADRLVAAYIARLLFPDTPAVISIDYGTATTFDCVEGQAYVGGLIAPGVMSSLWALSSKTAQLPSISLTTDSTALTPCRNTVTSMNQGFLFGFAAMTDGVVKQLRTVLPSPCPVVATGGFAESLAGLTSCFDVVRHDLLLEGLRRLWLDIFQKRL